MQETTHSPANPLLQGGNALRNLSYLAFFLAVGISLVLYALSWMSDSHTASLDATTQEINKKIQTISADRNIVIAKIIQENNIRPSIDLKGIVTQFRLAAIKANVAFDGFHIKDDVISTTLVSTQGTTAHPDAVATIIDMMNAYAHSNQAFSLGHISSVSGDPAKRSTTIELRVNPRPIQ